MTKHVFVWRSYGGIQVFALDTLDQKQSILESVFDVAILSLYGEDRDRAFRIFDENYWKSPLLCIPQLIEMVGEDQDDFQDGTGFYVVEG